MPKTPNTPADLIATELKQQTPDAVQTIATAVRQRHQESTLAILFYGSCLRDQVTDDRVIDLYLLVDDYGRTYDSRLEALANRCLPPNVYYIEAEHQGTKQRAKFAVLTMSDFVKGVTGKWYHPYLWARFAQPCALIYQRDDATAAAITEAVARAPSVLLEESAPFLKPLAASRDRWIRAFQETYRCELRAEGKDRATALYEYDAARYDTLTEMLKGQLNTAVSRQQAEREWRRRRAWGKVLSVLRLLKAAFTFRDGADYLLWKIERHSGVSVTLSPWQRRHPILASPGLFWRLYRKGAFR